MKLSEAPGHAGQRDRISCVALSAVTGLVIFAAAFVLGMPYPAERANLLAAVWGALAAGSFVLLARTRTQNPRGTILTAVSAYSLLNAWHSLTIKETVFFAAKAAADSPYRITTVYESAWPDFLISPATSGLLAACWALTIELLYPGRGGAATAAIIVIGLALLGVTILSI